MPDSDNPVMGALAPISEALEADGARLVVSRQDSTSVGLLLELRPEACGECLLPKDQIELMALELLREIDAGYRTVTVEVTTAEGDPTRHADTPDPDAGASSNAK